MLWFHDISFWNWSFEDCPYKNNYLFNFIDSCIKSFLNKLDIPKVMVPNLPKRNVFLSYISWELLRFKFEGSFKNHLVANWRLAV